MGDVRRIDQERVYQFQRVVVHVEHFTVRAPSMVEARRRLESTTTPLTFCMWQERVDVGDFEPESRG